MSEKPQAVREDGQEDLLEQIITQGLEKMNAPTQATATAEVPPETAPSAPRQEPSGEAAHPASRRSKRSAVYLYLLVLFGAAFLMLLLAYFVQRRNNDDLRDSMNLSREELLSEIRELEEANAALENQNARLSQWYNHYKDESEQWQEQYEEIALQADWLWEQYYAAERSSYAWQSFWILEQSYQSGDYESCAAVLLLIAQAKYAYYAGPIDSDRERYMEIVQAVIDEGILDKSYPSHISDYEELIGSYLAEHEEITIYG